MIHCYRLTYQTVDQQVKLLVLLTHDHHCSNGNLRTYCVFEYNFDCRTCIIVLSHIYRMKCY